MTKPTFRDLRDLMTGDVCYMENGKIFTVASCDGKPDIDGDIRIHGGEVFGLGRMFCWNTVGKKYRAKFHPPGSDIVRVTRQGRTMWRAAKPVKPTKCSGRGWPVKLRDGSTLMCTSRQLARDAGKYGVGDMPDLDAPLCRRPVRWEEE